MVTDPALGAIFIEVAKPLLLEVETCTPVGAVTTILFVDKSVPETTKLCGAIVQPEQVVKVFNVPVVVIVGEGGGAIKPFDPSLNMIGKLIGPGRLNQVFGSENQ